MNDADIAIALAAVRPFEQQPQPRPTAPASACRSRRSLVELHGGTLEIASARDSGTTVRIILPADRVKYVPPPTAPARSTRRCAWSRRLRSPKPAARRGRW
jgi:hypothetical protein